MKRHFAAGFAFICTFALCAAALADAPGKLVPEADANAVGMTRAWFAQTTLERGREEVTSATFQDGVLFVTTENGRLQAFDGETGVTLWTVEVGTAQLLTPTVNSKVVAVVCGTDLVVYDRFTGKKLSETALYGNPSAGPVATEREIYVPLFSERLAAYPIVKVKKDEDKVSSTLNTMNEAAGNLGAATEYWAAKFAKIDESIKNASYMIENLDEKRPYSCASFGVSMVQPIVGTQTYEKDIVGWTTDQGWLVLGELLRRSDDDPFKLLYKFQARPNYSYVNGVRSSQSGKRVGNRALIPRDDVESQPFFIAKDKSMQNMRLDESKRKGGLFIIGTDSGHVYAMNDLSGMIRWTFLTRTPVSQRVSAFGDHAYIPTQSGDLFAVELKTGDEAWVAPDVEKTIAASQTRLYTLDSRGRIVIIDRQNGQRLKTFEIGQARYHVFNKETDRVYLVSADGLIQCLHETQLATPFRHNDETCEDISNRIYKEMRNENPEKEKSKSASTPIAVADDNEEEETEVAEEENDPFADNAEAEEDDPFADDTDDSSSANDEDPFGGDDEDDPFGGDF